MRKVYKVFGILLICIVMIITSIPTVKSEAKSKTIQVGTMILEFTDASTVVLKKIVSTSNQIPSKITYAFIKKIIISEGIKNIPEGLFVRFPNAETISLSSTVTNFETGTHVFIDNIEISVRASLEKLKVITVSNKNKKYKSIDGILYSKDGKSIIYYPKGKTNNKFIIPDTITSIQIENKYITDITFGEKIKQYNLQLPALKNIIVNKNNKNYKSIGGVLFSKDGKRLLKYPEKKTASSYTVPKGTERLDYRAFENSSILSLSLSEGLQYIDGAAFMNTKIRSITLPKSLSGISQWAFDFSSINAIYVNKDNPTYSSYNGVLYNKQKSKLIYWPEKKAEEKLIFPETLTELDLSIIPTLDAAKTIVIPKALTSITNTAANKIQEVILKDGNSNFVLNQGILYSKDLTNIKLYPNNNSIKEIILPDSVTEFDWSMFTYENNTTSLTLSKNLKTIIPSQWRSDLFGNYYFGFHHLEQVTISEDNPFYTSKDGILYSKDMTSLLLYPQNHKNQVYTIPDTVKSVAQSQLVNVLNLVELNIPKDCIREKLEHTLGLETGDGQTNFYYYKTIWGSYSPKLERINVDSRNSDLKSEDNVLLTKDGSILLLYPAAKEDKAYVVPSSVSIINSDLYNPYLEELTFSIRTSEVSEQPHNGGDAYFYYHPFLYLTALKKIIVPLDNEYYKSIDGVLYSKSGNVMVAYPIDKEDKVLRLSSNLQYLQGTLNLECALALKEIQAVDHDFYITKNGGLYYFWGPADVLPGIDTTTIPNFIKQLYHY